MLVYTIFSTTDAKRSAMDSHFSACLLFLLSMAGTCPSADAFKNILGSVGADADEERIELLLSEVKGKDITELIAAGREKLALVSSGGGGGGVAVAATAGGGGGAPAAATEPKKVG